MKIYIKYLSAVGLTLFALLLFSSGAFAAKAAKPTVSPSAGTYTGPRTITMSSSSSGVTIRYTTDGQNPSETYGTIYTSPVRITESTYFKIVAYGGNYSLSSVAKFQFNINGTSATTSAPVFSPSAGNFSSSQTVTISSSTSGAVIRYTTDGTTPTVTSGTLYTSGISVNATTTIKAIAYADGYNVSPVTPGTFTISSQVQSPVFSPEGGNYNSPQTVTIVSPTSGASIRYTTDGTIPTDEVGTVYTTPISLSSSMTLKAIAYKSGMTNSYITSAVYFLKCIAPVFTPSAGSFDKPIKVTLTSETPGATIRYTSNGEAPTSTSGTVYSAQVSVNTTMTIKAIAYKSGLDDSDISMAAFALGSEDVDDDGVIDPEDEYPNDPTRALVNTFPASGTGTLAFEDLWPSQGDFDLNDVVVDFSFKTITDGSNKLVETYCTFVLRATGAALKNGFGFQLAANSIPASAITVSGMRLTREYITLSAKGTEANQNIPTFIVFDNAFDLLDNPGSGAGINTTLGAPYVSPVTIVLHIVYTPGTYDLDLLDIEHFNPFIMVNMIRGREVHLPDYAPTSLADQTLFGTSHDTSIPGIGRYYKTVNNLPWALITYEIFDYPTEKAVIMDTYLHFAEWVQSSGTKYPDWYKNVAGYRNEANIYKH